MNENLLKGRTLQIKITSNALTVINALLVLTLWSRVCLLTLLRL
jgi:hypothetical protein